MASVLEERGEVPRGKGATLLFGKSDGLVFIKRRAGTDMVEDL
jgi:hypothetical protein